MPNTPEYLYRDDISSASHLQEPASEGPTLGTMAKEMATFGLASMFLKKASSGISRGVFKSIVKKNKRLATSIAAGAGGTKDLGKLQQSITGAGLFRGVQHSLMGNSAPKLFRARSDAAKGWLGALSSAAEVSHSMGKVGGGALKSMAKSHNIATSFAARAGLAMAKAVPSAAGFYAIGRPLGMLSHGDKELPAWYNIPGHVGEVAKLTAEFAAFEGVLHGGKRAVQGVFKKGKGFIAAQFNAQKAPGVHKFLDNTLAKTTKNGNVRAGSFFAGVVRTAAKADAIRGGISKAGEHVSVAVRDLWGNKAARGANFSPARRLASKQFWKQTLAKAKSEHSLIYKTRTRTLFQNNGNNAKGMLDFIGSAVAKHYKKTPEDFRRTMLSEESKGLSVAAKLSNTANPFGDKFFNKMISNINKENKIASGSMGGKDLRRPMARGWNALEKSDKRYAKKLYSFLQETAPGESQSIKNFATSFRKMYAGKGMFKQGHTGVIDYSMLAPRNVLKAAFDYADPILTIPVPPTPFSKGGKLPLLKILGVQKLLATKGKGLYAIGNEEDQYYKQLVSGHGRKETRNLNQGHNYSEGSVGGLGGVYIDGELWYTKGGVQGLTKVKGSDYKLVPITPHDTSAQLFKLDADKQLTEDRALALASQHVNWEDKTPGIGFIKKASKFMDNRGIEMPGFVKSMINTVQRKLDIGPQTAVFRSGLDILMNADKAKSHRRDFGALLGSFVPMAEEARRELYPSLANAKMMRRLGKMSQNTMKSKDAGQTFRDLERYYSKDAMHDKEFLEMFTKNFSSLDDQEVKYIYNAARGNGKVNLDEIVTVGRIPMSRRDEMASMLIADAMGTSLHMNSATGADMKTNLAKRLMESPTFSKFSKNEQGNLRMMATHIDLYQFGGVGRKMYGSHNAVAVAGTANDVVKKYYKGRENELLQAISTNPSTKGYARNKKDWLDQEYDKIMKGITSPYATNKHGQGVSAYMLVEKGDFAGGILRGANTLADKVMGMGDAFGIRYGWEQRADNMVKLPNWGVLGKFSGAEYKLGGPLKTMGRRIAQGVGTMAALQAADAFTDANPLFAGTILDEGIFVGAAEIGIKAGMAFHKAKDIMGVTEMAKYSEGLMPGSTTSIPGGIIGGLLGGPLGIPVGMMANRFLQNALPDLDKSYDEMKEIYSGRELVPVKRGRWWALSKSDYQGTGAQYYRPHWFPRMKSQYKYTESLYGSKAEAFFHKPWSGLGYNPFWLLPGVDKYHYEKKHYYTRPYPTTSAAFSDVPIIGGLLGGTIGRLPIIGKPIQRMHQEEMRSYYNTERSGSKTNFGELAKSRLQPPTKTDMGLYMNLGTNDTAYRENVGGHLPRMNKYALNTMLGEQAYNFTEAAGLKGFLSETVMGGHPWDNAPRLSSAKDMMSTRRAYWDLNLGDMFFSTEFFRRFVPREKRIWQKINPLRNRMPGWLPGGPESEHYLDFLGGDPFTKIPEGEIRLPGAAYSTLYDVKHTFPGRASSLGKHVQDSVRWMTGLSKPFSEDMEDILEEGTELHRAVQKNLEMANLVEKSEKMVYDERHNIMGYIDIVMHDPTQKGGVRAVEVKTVSGKKFGKLKAPIPAHVSQINFYIRQLQGGNVGTLLYINRDDPTAIRTFDVRYNEERWRKDIMNLEKAREISAGIMADGKGFEDGAGYSYLDRYRILADVAPSSKEYKKAKKIVGLQLRLGKFAPEEIEQIAKIEKHRSSVLRKYDLYPTRFRGRVMDPDAEYNLMSDNENIKAASEYSFSERVLGSMWERFIQMNTPVNTKLWNYRTPLQHYQRTRLYGTESAFWSKPWQDIIKPMGTQAIAADTPMDGATNFGWLGFIGAGGIGGGFMTGGAAAAAGMAYGAARNIIGADAWIPGAVKKKREIERTFDEMKYMRAKQLFDTTGDTKYLGEAENTMYSIRQKGYDVGMGTILRSLSNFERSHFKSFLAETDKSTREQILQSVPHDVSQLLRKQWAQKDGDYSNMVTDGPVRDRYLDGLPKMDWGGFAPDKQFEDIKIKTIMNEGFDAHDFGLGWYDDMRRIANSPYKSDPINIHNNEAFIDNTSFDVQSLKNTLKQTLSSVAYNPLISVGYTSGGDKRVQIQINVTRDRRREIQQMVRGY